MVMLDKLIQVVRLGMLVATGPAKIFNVHVQHSLKHLFTAILIGAKN